VENKRLGLRPSFSYFKRKTSTLKVRLSIRFSRRDHRRRDRTMMIAIGKAVLKKAKRMNYVLWHTSA
jgi:hypothetical protein